MDVAVAFPLKKQFHHPFFKVASYSHANECSGRFTVFESTVICCEFFFLLNHVYLVLRCHVYAIICFTIYNVGEGP